MSNDTTTPLTFAGDEGHATQAGLAGNSCVNGSDNGDGAPPIADFIEPVRYEWTVSAYEVRQAVKKYSEETHADY